ncbi:MAG: hypothetical protein WCV62_06690 [Candidatus Peribacteraceae bacterium]
MNHLNAQKRPAVGCEGSCLYRHEVRGRVMTCAVGCLIPESKYNPSFEGNSITASGEGTKALRRVLGLGSEFLVPADAEKLDLLRSLQQLHDAGTDHLNKDGTFSLRYLREGERRIAEQFGIKIRSLTV